jgi:hypothetical protein
MEWEDLGLGEGIYYRLFYVNDKPPVDIMSYRTFLTILLF